MSSKKVSEVSVIITCQDEDAGPELSSEEYDQLVKVQTNFQQILSYPAPPDDKVYGVRDCHSLESFQGRFSLRLDK